MHGWAKGMKTPEVCFVVGLVSFSGTAGVERRKGKGTEDRHSSFSFIHLYLKIQAHACFFIGIFFLLKHLQKPFVLAL